MWKPVDIKTKVRMQYKVLYVFPRDSFLSDMRDSEQQEVLRMRLEWKTDFTSKRTLSMFYQVCYLLHPNDNLKGQT